MKIRINNVKFNRTVINVISKGNMHIGGTHACDNSKILNKSEAGNTSCECYLYKLNYIKISYLVYNIIF